jgi:hypothetical protein
MINNKMIYYLDLIHNSSLEYYINKIKTIKKNNHEEIWVTDDYPLDFPLENNSLYNSEESFCFCIIVHKEISVLYEEQYDHFVDENEYIKRGKNPMEAMKYMYILLDPNTKICEKTSNILTYLENRLVRLNGKVKQLKPRKLLSQFVILPEYLKI